MITHHSLKKGERICVIYDLEKYEPQYYITTTNAHNVQIRYIRLIKQKKYCLLIYLF